MFVKRPIRPEMQKVIYTFYFFYFEPFPYS